MSPSVTLLGKPRPAFQVCGYTGLLLAFVQSSVLVAYLGLSQLTLFGMTGVVILTNWWRASRELFHVMFTSDPSSRDA
jgi:hypothetical protein